MSKETQGSKKESIAKKVLLGTSITALAASVGYGIARKADKDHLVFGGRLAYRKANRKVRKAHVAKDDLENCDTGNVTLTEWTIDRGNKRKAKATKKVNKATAHLDKRTKKLTEKSEKVRPKNESKADKLHDKATKLSTYANDLKTDLADLDLDNLTLAKKRISDDEGMRDYQLRTLANLAAHGKNVANPLFTVTSANEWKTMCTSSDLQVKGAARGFLFNWNDTAQWQDIEWHSDIANLLFSTEAKPMVVSMTEGTFHRKEKTVKSWFDSDPLERDDIVEHDGYIYYEPEDKEQRVVIGFRVGKTNTASQIAKYAQAKIDFAIWIQVHVVRFMDVLDSLRDQKAAA